MKQSWMRFLNPFHFETRTLLWLVWANVLIALMFCPLTIYAFVFLQPQAARLASLTENASGHFEKITDATRLREILLSQLNYDHDVWLSLYGLWGALGFIFVVVVGLGLGNAFYQFKAYKLLKAKTKDSRSSD